MELQLLTAYSKQQRIWNTRKRGNCECTATWGRPSHAIPFPVLITMSCQVWRRWTYPLPYYNIFAAGTLLYAVTLTSDLIFDFEYLQRIACDVRKLYQIWIQSSNSRPSYCDFSVWPYDLEHALSVGLGSETIFTKFDLRQLIRAWIIAFLMLIRYVTLRPWSLTRWP